jgi:hypothetical protein
MNRRRNRTRFMCWTGLFGLAIVISAGIAEAHTSERAFILLLPTELYIIGGTLTVALSFVVMALMPTRGLRAMEEARLRLFRMPGGDMAISLLAAAFWAGLVAAGFLGSRDPLSNPLPMVVWTLWWVGLSFLHVVFGNLWAVVNPWTGIYRLLMGIPALKPWRRRPPLAYPAWAGHWPAVLLLIAFGWFELIHPAPQDPDLLASVVGVYLVAVLVAMVLFGADVWLGHAEPFTFFFRMVSWLSPFEVTGSADDGGRRLSVRMPGMGLASIDPLPLAATAFVILVLATVSFDGLSRTFWYYGVIDANPLEPPGRTALMGVNSLGLCVAFLVLGSAYGATVYLGRLLAPAQRPLGQNLSLFVVSVVPIAFGYHFAHYLTALMLDGQHAWKALSDPFARGWDLFGAADHYVTGAFLNDHHLVEMVWRFQVSAIVLAHIAAVIVSHFLALRDAPSMRAAVLGQTPLTVLMIGYTLFGLWLLSSPTAG